MRNPGVVLQSFCRSRQIRFPEPDRSLVLESASSASSTVSSTVVGTIVDHRAKH